TVSSVEQFQERKSISVQHRHIFLSLWFESGDSELDRELLYSTGKERGGEIVISPSVIMHEVSECPHLKKTDTFKTKSGA
ncbi:hypothetical protein ACQP3F_33915, partial [Escherichia coli]